MSRPSNSIAPDGRLGEAAASAAPQRRLAAARLADQAERLARAAPPATRRRPRCTRGDVARARRRCRARPGSASVHARPRSSDARLTPARSGGSPLARALLPIGSQQRVEVVRRRAWRLSGGGSAAALEAMRAAVGEARSPAGRSPSAGRRLPAIAVRRCGRGRSSRGDRAEQPPRVRVQRVVEDRALGPCSTIRPAVHDQHAVGELGDHAHVVRDQHHRRAASRAAASGSGRGSAPGSSRRARSSARRRSARSGCTRAPSRSSRAAACRRRTGAGSRRRAARRRGSRPSAAARSRGRAPPRLERLSCARTCSAICQPTV